MKIEAKNSWRSETVPLDKIEIEIKKKSKQQRTDAMKRLTLSPVLDLEAMGKSSIWL